MNQLISNAVVLPAVPNTVLPILNDLTEALGIPRDVLASDEEIHYAWQNLPRELKDIPVHLRDELIARMCIAVSTGLFDGAMNYIWNASILQLRNKIRNFGIPVVNQILQGKKFEEAELVEMQDHRLIELCLKLNLIDEDGYFFLDQCREVRNNFSAAHPTMGKVNDREFTAFLNRCVRYALMESISPKGVDSKAFIESIKGARFTSSQLEIWVNRLKQTHDAQRQLLVGTVHGIYCDSSTSETARLNALEICEAIKEDITSATKTELVDRHYEYQAKGDEIKHIASLKFFESLGFLNLLNEIEIHNIFSSAVRKLWNVHNAIDNFYNEPPFAERLLEISKQNAVPSSIQEEFVEVVMSCRIGNRYGVSHAAVQYYDEMIRNFSPKEVFHLMDLLSRDNTILKRRVESYPSCQRKLKSALALIESQTVPTSVKTEFERLLG